MNTYFVALIAINLILFPLAAMQAADMWHKRSKSILTIEFEWIEGKGLSMDLTCNKRKVAVEALVASHVYDKANEYCSTINSAKVVELCKNYFKD